MADAQQNDNFTDEVTTAFAEDNEVVEHKTTPEAEKAATPETTTPPANVEEVKEDDPANPEEQNKGEEEQKTPPADPKENEEKDGQKPQDPETPPTQEETPQPLTEEGVRRLLNEARTQERNSMNEFKTTFNDVMETYYPDGLSNVLVDQNTGKELRTPQDVVDATGGEMNIEQAAQWLMNEQYKLDNNINDIRRQAEQIAETNINFKRDSLAVLQKYEPLFNAYPQLQNKIYNLMMKQVKIDEDKGIVLQAPDVVELYDTYLEPYQRAYEISTQQPVTNPEPPQAPPAKPGINDRLDEGGDGGANTEVDDPNDFAQQITKELAKGA